MNATDKQRHFRSDFFLTGPLTDAQLALLLSQLAGAAELCGARVSGGWVETDAAGEALDGSDDTLRAWGDAFDRGL